MKPVSLGHNGDISANLDQAMSKKKKKTGGGEGKYIQKHTQLFRPNWPKFCIWEEFLIISC